MTHSKFSCLNILPEAVTKQVIKVITVYKNGILTIKVYAFDTADIDNHLSEGPRDMGPVLETLSCSF